MKKLIAMLLVLVMVFSLTACGTDDGDQTSQTTATNQAEATTAGDDGTDNSGTVTAEELLDNVNVRKAIAYGFDKTYITDIILGNGAKPVDYFVPTGLHVSSDGVDFRDANPDGYNHYDIDKAKEYWNKAKEELGIDSAEIELLTYDAESSKKLSEYIQGQLQDNLEGLKIVINQQPFKNKLQLADEGQFELEYAGWLPDYPDAMTFLDMWVTGGGQNTAGYSNETYDANIARAKTGDLTTDPAARTELLQDTERVLLDEDVVLVPLFQTGSSLLQNPEVTNIITHQFGGDFTFKKAQTTIETDGKHIIRMLGGDDIPTMDTNLATNQVSFYMMANVLEGLTTLGEGDTLEPAGAYQWEVSEDGTEYTFHLVEDAKWSNGDPVTAHDYVYSWRRLADPNTGSQYQFMIETAQVKNYAAVMSGEAPLEDLGVEAVDDYTLKVSLEAPVPYFLKLMFFPNFYPVNQAFVESVGDDFGTSVETTIYNGPYNINQWEIGYGYGMEKSETYWDKDNVMNDGVTFRIVKDSAAGVNLYVTGEVDRTGLTGEFVEQYIDHPHFKVTEGSGVYYLIFNIGNQGSGNH